MHYLHIILAWLYWNPERVVFTIPVIDRPIVWYGLWFVSGFIAGYFILIAIFKRKLLQIRNLSLQEAHNQAVSLVDRLTWFVVGGTLIGARLGHVFFYEWPRYQHDWLEIFKVWNGGLASHGGTLGILIALFFYQRLIRSKYPEFTFVALLDMLAVPTPLACCLIRIGNFFNQEILGIPTTLPWGIIFGNPADGSAVVPRHPVQLYEAGIYLFTFFLLFGLWKKKGEKLATGTLIGLLFVLVYGFRFFIEFLKVPQGMMIDESWLQTGQYLSIPFVIAGILLMRYGQRLKCMCNGK